MGFCDWAVIVVEAMECRRQVDERLGYRSSMVGLDLDSIDYTHRRKDSTLRDSKRADRRSIRVACAKYGNVSGLVMANVVGNGREIGKLEESQWTPTVAISSFANSSKIVTGYYIHIR
jgi:hypothetical protein